MSRRRTAAGPAPEPRSLPCSEETERAVLAAVLLDPAAFAGVREELGRDDFFSDRHQLIWSAMCAAADRGLPPDLRTVQDQLGERLDDAGGIGYLVGLDLDLPDLARLEAYLQILREHGVRRRGIAAAYQAVRDLLDRERPAFEALARYQTELAGLGRRASGAAWRSLAGVLAGELQRVEDKNDPEAAARPMLATGFPDLDGLVHFDPGHLVVLAGRPSMGKTALALSIARNVALEQEGVVAIFSLEMSAEELALRLLSAEAEVPNLRFRSGHLSQHQWTRAFAATRRIQEAGDRLLVDDSASLGLPQIASRARWIAARIKLRLLIVDYLQLVTGSGGYRNRNEEVGATSRGLKQLAKELGITVIALSQLSRESERRGGDFRPRLSDLRESGAIEQDADLVVFIHRPEVYQPDDGSLKGLAEAIVAKQRNGETGTVPLAFDGPTTNFKPLSARAPF